MEKTLNPTKVWNKGFILIFIANVFMHMGQQTITTLIPKYAYAMGATATIVGIVSGAFAMSALFSKPFTSPLFLCVKKKHLYIFACFLLMSAYVVFYFAPNVNWLIGGRLFHGIAIGMAAPLSLNMACDNLPEDKFAKGVGLFSLGQALGQALGPSVGLSLSRSIGFKNTFLICLLMMAICTVIAFFVDSNPKSSDKYRIRLNTIVEPHAIPIAVTMLFIVMAYSCIPSFLAIYGELLGIDNIGLYFTVYAVAMLVLRFTTSGVADKLGYRKVVSVSLVCFMVTFVLFGASKALPGFIAAAIFAALGYGLTLPNMQALCMTSVPSDRRGVASNTMYLGQDLGQSIGPSIAGALIDALILKKCPEGVEYASDQIKAGAYSTMYYLVVIVLVIAVALVIYTTGKVKNIHKKDVETDADSDIITAKTNETEESKENQ